MRDKFLPHGDELLYLNGGVGGTLLKTRKPSLDLKRIQNKSVSFNGSDVVRPNGYLPFLAEEGFMYIVPKMDNSEGDNYYDGVILSFSDKFFGFYRGLEYFFDNFPNKLPILSIENLIENSENSNALTIYSIFPENFCGETQEENMKKFIKYKNSLTRIIRKSNKTLEPLDI